jgi:thioredoxin-like negative regulator of GroEL
VKLIKVLKITTLIVLTIGISLVKFYNPVFAGPAEDTKYQIEATKNLMSGDLDSAKSLIEKIEDTKIKNVLIVGLATNYLIKGDLDSAKPLIEKIENTKTKEDLMVGLATNYLTKGDLDSAKPLIEKIENTKVKEDLMVGLATGYIRKEDFNSAEPFIDKIKDKKLKETLATTAMTVCLKKGEMKKASEFLFSYVEEEQVLTNILFVFLTKYKDKSDYLGMTGFVSRFIFSGKIFQVKW